MTKDEFIDLVYTIEESLIHVAARAHDTFGDTRFTQSIGQVRDRAARLKEGLNEKIWDCSLVIGDSPRPTH